MGHLAAVLNTLLSLNRLGRGNAALFLLLSFATLGPRISLATHLVLGLTAALWYDGLNDLMDLEIDRAAYAARPYRKVLLNGSMTARGLWAWLVALSLVSGALLVVDLGAGATSFGLFIAGVLCGVVYNLYSKHLRRPSVAKSILLDAAVGGPFYFYYGSLALISDPRPDFAMAACTIGSLVACGLYGNFVFAAKDLSTDAARARTLPMMLGTKLGGSGAVQHSGASKAWLILLTALTCGLLGWAASRGHWFALPFAVRLLAATVRICSGKVDERGHKKTFIRLSNWEMLFLLTLHLTRFSPSALATLVAAGGTIILLNVTYYFDGRAKVMLKLGAA